VIPLKAGVIPAKLGVIPAKAGVIPENHPIINGNHWLPEQPELHFIEDLWRKSENCLHLIPSCIQKGGNRRSTNTHEKAGLFVLFCVISWTVKPLFLLQLGTMLARVSFYAHLEA
jgi:hypothetical protein